MRLFGLVDGTIDHHDRAFFWGMIFDLDMTGAFAFQPAWGAQTNVFLGNE